MPQAIPLVVAAGASAAFAGAAAAGTTGLVIASVTLSATALTAIGVGLTIVGALVQMLLTPQPARPKFEDGSQSIKQAIPARTRCYGYYRLAGAYIYYLGDDIGDLHTLVCHCAHRINRVVVHWLNDETVEVDPVTGHVISGVYNDYDPILPVTVTNWLGLPGQIITSMPDEWMTPPGAHRGEGLACTHVKYSDLKPDLQQKVYGNGAPAYRAALEGALIYDPAHPGAVFGNEATYSWSDNAALVVLDYLTRTEPSIRGPIAVGFGIPADRIDLASFVAAAAVCNQAIPLKAGGTEKRWRACFAYDLIEDRKQVLSDLLDSCSGRLTQGPDGRLGLSVGAPDPVAGVTVTDPQVLEYDLSSGKAAIERINEVRATYVSPLQDWAEIEAGIQNDQEAIDRNGVESASVKIRCAPSDGQAQRLAKSVLKKGSPRWAGKLRGSLAMLNAWGERWVRLTLAELGIDQIFEVSSMSLDRNTMSVEMNVTSYDGWFDWDAATDEQDPAVIPATPGPIPVTPAPTGVVANVVHRQIDDRTIVATAVVSWNPPPTASFNSQGRWREVGGIWQMVGINPDDLSFETPPLENGKMYEGGSRFMGPRGTVSEWVTTAPFQAVADPTAPAVPTLLTAMVVTGAVNLSAKAPNESRFAAIRFWRAGTNNPALAVYISGAVFGPPNGTALYVDHPGAGDWWYFATSENWSAVKSAKTAGVLGELAPPAPVITTAAGTIGQTNPTITGTSDPSASIKVFANSVLNTTTTANGSGNWSVPLIALGSGAQAITATATIAGNESAASGSVTLTVVWYDPDASGQADFKAGLARLNGASSTLALLFDSVVTSAQIVTNASGAFSLTAANALPISDLGLEVWETRTNRCTNRNAAPTDLTGVTLSGDPAATLTRVDDSATMVGSSILTALKAGGTLNGFVYKLDNTLGVADAFATISGAIAVVGACRGSVVYRGSAGRIEIGGATAVSFAVSSPYVRVGGGRTAAATTEQMRIAAPPGAVIFWLLNVIESGAFDTAPIICNAASATRSNPQIQRTVGADFSATQGFLGARARVASAGVTSSGVVLASLQTAITDTNAIQGVTTTGFRGLTQIASVQQAGPIATVPATVMTTMIYGYKLNDFAFAANGLAAITDVSGNLPSGTPAKLSVSLNLTPALNGVIEQVKWGTTKPTNAQIQAKSGWTTL